VRSQDEDYYSIVFDLEELLAQHYHDESALLEELRRHYPELAAKIKAQHEEVFEISRHLSDAVVGGQTETAWRLARRFHALSQHNLIEEEQDVFPLAARCFDF
jgi:hypothetical protein